MSMKSDKQQRKWMRESSEFLLGKWFHELPDECREVLITSLQQESMRTIVCLYYREGQTPEEIARVLKLDQRHVERAIRCFHNLAAETMESYLKAIS
jgi:DNA-directed RNA polymerase specialized sigma24 family protein